MPVNQSDYQKKFVDYFERMTAVSATMPDEERKELAKWEAENVGRPGGLATSDWPGWVKYLG